MDAEELTSEEEVTKDEKAIEQEQKPDVEAKETPQVPEADPKDAVIGDFRRNLRDSRADNDALRAQVADQGRAIEELRKPQEVVPKSPIEVLAAEDPQATPDAETFHRQSVWEANQRAGEVKRTTEVTEQQDQQRADKDRTTAINEAQVKAADEFSTEKVGQGLEFETIITMGEKFLTPGEKDDIRRTDPDKLWQLAYKLCKRAIAESGSAEAKLLSQREAVHKKGGKKEDKEDKEEEVPETTGKEEGTGEYAHVTSFMFDGDNAE